MSAVDDRRDAAVTAFHALPLGGDRVRAAIEAATTVELSSELVQAFHKAWAAEPLRVESDRHVKQTIRALCAAIGIEVRE